jgi:signal transduction histidine kinase
MKDTKYCISVRDNGRGMSKEELSSLAAFHQPGRNVNEQQGAGLGLAIVSLITNLYNAEMEIHSVQGEYTIVTLAFPSVAVSDE